jgi:hypothetical protein
VRVTHDNDREKKFLINIFAMPPPTQLNINAIMLDAREMSFINLIQSFALRNFSFFPLPSSPFNHALPPTLAAFL